MPPVKVRDSDGTLLMRGTKLFATTSAGSAKQLMKNFAVGVSAPAEKVVVSQLFLPNKIPLAKAGWPSARQ